MTNFLYNAHCACPLNYFLFFCFLCLASLFLSIVHLQFFTFLQSSLLLYSPLFFGGSLLLSSSSIFSVLISTLLFQSILISFHLIPSLFFFPILFSVLIYSPLLCSFILFTVLLSSFIFFSSFLISVLCQGDGRYQERTLVPSFWGDCTWCPSTLYLDFKGNSIERISSHFLLNYVLL